MPDADMPLTTWPDVGRHGKRKRRRHKPEVEITFERKVMATRSQRLAPHLRQRPTATDDMAQGRPTSVVFTSGLYCRHFLSRCRPTSGHVDRGISTSGIVENVGVAIETSLLSHASPEIQCTSGLNAAILFSGCQRMSVNVDDGTVELGIVENIGVAVGISLITCPEK